MDLAYWAYINFGRVSTPIICNFLDVYQPKPIRIFFGELSQRNYFLLPSFQHTQWRLRVLL